MRSKWLKKAPNSITDMWKIMEEAKRLYEQHKEDKRIVKKAYEDSLLKQGVFVGSKVKVMDDSPDFKDQEFEVLAIRRNNVRLKNLKTEKTWKLQNFRYEAIK